MLLSRDAILAAPVPTTEVEVPEWGGSVLIRALSIKSRVLLYDAIVENEAANSAWREDQAKPEEERDGLPRVDIRDQSILTVIFGIVDDNGEHMFDLSDYNAFAELDYTTIIRLWSAMMAHERREPEALKKKFRENPRRRFVFRLALALGKTVAQLNHEMGPDELAEWEAYYFFEPFGSPIEDYRSDVLAKLMWYPNYKGEAPEYFDHDYEETARLAKLKAASVTLEDRILAAFGGLNVIDETVSD